MREPLGMSDLDFSFVPEAVKADPYWRTCLLLALRGKSKDQRYGALLMLGEGTIGGKGHNRLLGRMESCPFKTSFFLHAEADAIRDAILTHGEGELRGSTLFVAGLLPRERRPLIRRLAMVDHGSCRSCAKLYARFGISVAVITEGGWVRLDGSRALRNTEIYSKREHRDGLNKREFRKRICL